MTRSSRHALRVLSAAWNYRCHILTKPRRGEHAVPRSHFAKHFAFCDFAAFGRKQFRGPVAKGCGHGLCVLKWSLNTIKHLHKEQKPLAGSQASTTVSVGPPCAAEVGGPVKHNQDQ
jgi:hypothetical protein